MRNEWPWPQANAQKQLPELLSQSIPKINSADLLFVIGTSLTIQPFAKLASMAPDSCPRVLINLDFAGDIGTRADDVLLLGKCDGIVRDLCRELGWADALEREWAKTELPSSRPSTGILSPKDNNHTKGPRGLQDAQPPHEQLETGRPSAVGVGVGEVESARVRVRPSGGPRSPRDASCPIPRPRRASRS